MVYKQIGIKKNKKRCVIIGDPVEHSLSPAMHNEAYKSLGIDSEFYFDKQRVKSEELGYYIDKFRTEKVRGITCTIPHKVEVMKYLDEIDEVARKIGAVNTVVNTNGTLKGYNTDYLGVAVPIDQCICLSEARYAIIGAGGAARGVAFVPFQEGAYMKIFNRTKDKARELAEEFNCDYAGIDEIENLDEFDVIINATSVGMGDLIDETPLVKKYITSKHIVFDAVYVPYETKLLREAKEKGVKMIHGIEMLLYQGMAQFELYTGHKAPEYIMRKVLMENLKF